MIIANRTIAVFETIAKSTSLVAVVTPYLGERDFLEALVARITARGVAEEGVFLGGLLLNPEGESRSDPPFGARTLGDPVQAGLWTLKKPPSKILSLGSPFSSTLVERTARNKDV